MSTSIRHGCGSTISTILILALGLPLSQTGWAQSFEPTRFLDIHCNIKKREITAGFELPEDSSAVKHRVTYGDLLTRGRFDEKYQVTMLSGSKSAFKTCGPYRIEIQDGFANSNPMGELGTVSFHMIRILKKDEPVTRAIKFERCITGIDRYGYCPDEYAMWFRFSWNRAQTEIKIVSRKFFSVPGAEDREIEETIIRKTNGVKLP